MDLKFAWLKDFSALSGATLYLAVLVMLAALLIVALVALRYYFPPGSQRLEAKVEGKEAERLFTNGQLEEQRQWYESQIKSLKEEHDRERKEDRQLITELQQRMGLLEDRLKQEESWNREYRHALANREHVLGFALDTCLQFVDALLEECTDVAPHFRRQRAHMKNAHEMRQEIPLPTMRIPSTRRPASSGASSRVRGAGAVVGAAGAVVGAEAGRGV